MAHRIQAKLSLSKVIPHGTAPVRLGRYTLIPSSDSRNEITLDFLDEYVDRTGSGGSHPEEEARIVSDILAMLLNVEIRRVGFQIDDIVLPPVVEQQRQLQAFPEAHGALDLTLVDRLSMVSNLEQDVLLQYVRACRAYGTALTVVHYDAAFAFMLFVVSIECLASQGKVFPKTDLPLGQTRNRFLRFLKEFAGDLGVDDEVSDQLLRLVYDDLRSAFVHGGKEAPGAAALADSVDRPYIKHQSEGGRDTRTPGVRWFARVVRSALVGFLGRHRGQPSDDLGIPRIASERAVIRLRPRQDCGRGDVLAVDDEHFDLS